MSIGLGLERLGLWTLARQRIGLVLVVMLCVLSALLIPRLSFDDGLLKQRIADDRVWSDYTTIQDAFGVTAPSLNIVFHPPEREDDIEPWLKAQSGLVFDLRLLDGVADVQSIFSLRRPMETGAGTQPLIPITDLPQGLDALENLVQSNSDAALFMSSPVPYARMSIFISPSQSGAGEVIEAVLKVIAEFEQTSQFTLSLSGPSIVQAEISKALMRDLRLMVLASTAIGWMVGLFFFTNIRAAAICNIAGPVAMLWTAGFVALTGTSLNAITIILPLLSSVIAFADTVHLVVPFQRRLAQGEDRLDSIRYVMKHVGPASALTSVTTALAFGSLAIAGGAMVQVAWLGVTAVLLAWVCVMTVVPLLCLAMAKTSLGTTRVSSGGAQAWFLKLAETTARRQVVITSVAMVFLVGLLIAAQRVPSDHLPNDYLPESSSAHVSETLLETYFSGSMSTVIAMPLAETGDILDPLNLDRLITWQEAIETATQDPVLSRAAVPFDLWPALPTPAPDVSKSGDKMLLVINHGWSEAGATTLDRIHRIRSAIAPLPEGELANVSGLSAVIALSSISNVDRLRASLLISVFLAACLVAFVSRNIAAGVAVGCYVLMSALLTLIVSGALQGAATYGMTIALIVAIGIAIDNGIHIINAAKGELKTDLDVGAGTWCRAVAQSAGPILVSSAMIILALSVTQFVQMNALRGFGRDLIFALLCALILTFVLIIPVAIFVDDLTRRRAS